MLEPLHWIIIAVVVVVVLAVIAIVVGLSRQKSKEISFEKKPEIEQQKPSSGNYQAQGGFNFTQASAAPAPVKEPVRKPEPAAPVAPTEASVTPQEVPKATPATTPVAEPIAPARPLTADKPEVASQPSTSVPEAPAKTAVPEASDAKPVSAEPVVESEAVETPTETPSANEAEEEAPAVVKAPVVNEEIDDEIAQAEAVEPVTVVDEVVTAPVEEKEAAPAAPEVPAPVETPAAPVQPRDEIAPVEGRIGRLRGNLSKSQNIIGRGVLGILSAGDLDEDAWEEIEDTLIMADLGAETTMQIVDKLRERIAARGVSSEEEARALLREVLVEAARPDLDRSIKAMPNEGKPAVIMIVGVNGTGKTTTTGKLSRVLVGMGHKVMLGAADTFRAAAADQLETWGRRVGATTVRGAEGADPASVAFDSVAQGIAEGVDVVLIDTAGRLHTSVGLMDQLGKVKRVVEKKAQVDEVLLVLDATVGQNGLMQARTFRDVVEITGVVLTKLDGTAKGGIVFRVQEELGVPVKLVGLGEGADDLAPFEAESFIDALLG